MPEKMKDARDRRGEHIKATVTVAEKEKADDVAKKRGFKSTSDWLRELALLDCRAYDEEQRKPKTKKT